MRVAVVAPPFIPVPPKRYGGTELFVGYLVQSLKAHGIDVVLYATGDSTAKVEVRFLYPKSEWPLEGEIFSNLKDVNHTFWAVEDAMHDCDILHLNNAPGLAATRFVNVPVVYTVHHPRQNLLSDFYASYPDINYVMISDSQKSFEAMPKMTTIHHGISMDDYQFQKQKQPYLSFIGRFAPVKGPHIAIEVAKKLGIPLRMAGEVQPQFKDYFENEVKPHIDGKFVEFIGEADQQIKNELLGNSMALLFPIEWDEPFGLVMIEAMACGTPVIALRGGSVAEVVCDGISGYVCENADQMVERIRNLSIPSASVRHYAEMNFSTEKMAKDYARLYESLITNADLVLPETDTISFTIEPGTAA